MADSVSDLEEVNLNQLSAADQFSLREGRNVDAVDEDTQTPISVINNVSPKLDPVKNVLHNYATHTYRITLGAMSLKDHLLITEDTFTKGVPKITTMIMQSGGGTTVDGTTRSEIFTEDFYLGELKMTTIIALNAQTNGSNTVGLEFTIIEPYAVSFIERLLALAEKLGYKNYIDIPYIFKIEFIGYDDAGKQIGVIPATTRYIPFKLTYMKFEVSAKGSMYECIGIPVNHFALNQSVATLPAQVQIHAGTVEEFFNGKKTGDSGVGSTGSLVHAVNKWYKDLITSKGSEKAARRFADEIEIQIDKSIGVHKLEVHNLSHVDMIKHDFDPSKSYMDPSRVSYSFQTDASITKVIEEIIKNSTFHTNQIAEEERIDQVNAARDFSRAEGRSVSSKNIEKKPFIHFKITSQYSMLHYDDKVNRYSYKAKFIVQPYETAGQQSANIGRSEIINVAKNYNYLFTGDNQDILSLDIKFDLAFYNSMTVNTGDSGEGSSSGNTNLSNGKNLGDPPLNNQDHLTTAHIEHFHAPATTSTGTEVYADRKKMKAAAVVKSIMQDSRGDMITLDLTIHGDPAFIKQDDILYRTDRADTSAFTDNGAIKQDNGDMYIRLRFNTNDDLDHETGLRVEGRQIPGSSFTRTSAFDGFYRIITLDNIFMDGKFTQELVVIRTYVQDTDVKSSNTNESSDSESGLVEIPVVDTEVANLDAVQLPNNTTEVNTVEPGAEVNDIVAVTNSTPINADIRSDIGGTRN